MHVETRDIHRWDVSVSEAKEIQRSLADRVEREGKIGMPELIAGVDISGADRSGKSRGAVVVLRHPSMEMVERSVVEMEVVFPYVPGLLSFREMPLILAACERIKSTPDLFIADAQGIAHPRRLGLASHLGLVLGVPTVGCAKSILCGRHGDLGDEPDDRSPLIDGGETVGVALRTRSGVKPVYVSVGHKINLNEACRWVLACCRGYRLPEPTRLAHKAASGKLS
ncbi:MAG: deoxyribonuclease V [Chloroflexota bacterium]|nr:deoxyribonuclease V [Chloroflexota bacterium]